MITRCRGGFGGVLPHGNNAKSRVVPRYENPQIIIELHFKIKQIRTPKNKFEREPSEKKFQKIQTPMFEKKSLPKQKEVFKRKVF